MRHVATLARGARVATFLITDQCKEGIGGPLVSQPVGKTYGWVRVEDDQGHRQLVYVPERELSGCKVGDILGFTVGANDRGAFAKCVEPVVEDEAA
jgi:hypothetical protein